VRDWPYARQAARSVKTAERAATLSPRTAAVGVGDYLAVKGIKKTAVQKALDSLAAAGKLTAKVLTTARPLCPATPACARV
jgi:hypothetical protein